MEHAGTLQISRRGSNRMGNYVYDVTFLPAGGEHPVLRSHRCVGDLALLKAIEFLITDGDRRLRAFHALHEEGQALIGDVVLSTEQAMKYGLGASARSGPVQNRGGRVQRVERDLTDDVARFLSEAKDRSFCHSCLTASVKGQFEDVRKVIYTLRFLGDVRVATGRCSICNRLRVLITGTE